jgi:D-alanyl-lipoteichoic acid acyltransferase DltB (MBOAT superfamily)
MEPTVCAQDNERSEVDTIANWVGKKLVLQSGVHVDIRCVVFNSLVFLGFLAIVLALYYPLKHRGQNWLLIVASYVFYGWWDYRFLGLLLFTTFFDYFCALWIEREPRPGRRRLLLASSMTVNLGVLCLFKYFNFFADSLQSALAFFGVHVGLPILHLVLPVGISFYTFLSMSYTIDVYRGHLKATHNPTDFMLYVAFFPHLVAGPIVRASFLLPQCQKPRRLIPEEVLNGLWLILMGYVKKVVIADRLAQVVGWGFSRSAPPFADANSWLVLYAFAFQIYGDFSGYTDIARGLSKLMGFELVVNFRAPYLVTDPASFWRNWHISLSTWLRDYLYIPLGGNRHGKLKTYRNLMLTMLLGGLWHGAGAAYVLWGFYHGTLLALQRLWQDLRHHKQDLAKTSELAYSAGPSSVMPPAKADLVSAASEDASHALKLGESVNDLRQAVVPASVEVCEAPPQSMVGSNRPDDVGNDQGPRSFVGHRFGLPVLARQFLWVFVFFHVTCIGWLLFRAGSVPHGVAQAKFVRDYLATLWVIPKEISPLVQGVIVMGLVCLFFQWKFELMNRFSRWPLHWQVVAVVVAFSAIFGLGVFEGAQFIYFQF